MTTARTEASSAASRSPAASAPVSASSNAFRTSGRSSVRIRTPPSRSTRSGPASVAAALKPPPSSLPLEDRLALVHERVDAFLLVLRGEQQVERLALELEAGLERGREREVDRLGRETDRDGRLLRDRPRERLRFLEPGRRGEVLREDADGVRLIRLEAASGED